MDMHAEALAREFSCRAGHMDNVIRLLDQGNTVPFIARYRKELHGSMDDQLLRRAAERLGALRRLEERRQAVRAALEEQGALTPALSAALEDAATQAEVEDVYRPFRPKRRTRASAAREKGLAPLAELLLAQTVRQGAPEELAAPYVGEKNGVASADEALAGAMDIVAETLSDDAALRRELKALYRDRGVLHSEAAGEEDSVYRLYYGREESVSRVQGHRVLAMNRGEREGFLRVRLRLEEAAALRLMKRRVIRPGSVTSPLVAAAAEDAWGRLLGPSLERELRGELTQAAEEGAIRAFGQNLRALLMQPPLRHQVTMGFDPAYRTGCKIAVVDPTGRVLDTAVVYPTPPHERKAEARAVLLDMIRRHGVTAVAIGNGTASRESEFFVAELLREVPGTAYMVVSEAGASVYSASPLGAEEFPEFDVSLRSAVSIARRLQDPLAELVKIDPKSIGVGQYQHDMPQARLEEALRGVVEDCVNAVGADLNTASASLLSYVAGLGSATARSIVAWRETHGAFASRSQLRQVPRLGPRAFEQCAGFLRIPGGENLLDNTAVHPESYAAAERLLSLCGCSPEDAEARRTQLPRQLAAMGEERAAELCGVGVPTLRDMAAELQKPGRDPRDALPPPLLRRDVTDMRDLRPGMRLSGTVRNVADFGAFVDIGVHQDGLVHVSRLADRFVRHPSEVVQAGDVVQVTVLEIDEKKGRISLSMRPQDAPA